MSTMKPPARLDDAHWYVRTYAAVSKMITFDDCHFVSVFHLTLSKIGGYFYKKVLSFS